MNKSYGIYKILKKETEGTDKPTIVLLEFMDGFPSEAAAEKHLQNSNYRGGDYMILPYYYKHQPDN